MAAVLKTVERQRSGGSNIDIITSAVALQNLCIVSILRRGGGKPGLTAMFNTLNGASAGNAAMAETLYRQAEQLRII